jgi:aspartyl-tRNA(Asn)/glutamyl-tRNA(Gln) amidotransferase subunit B|tara:strand:+ start:6284 stop:7729 length:1446 start_codon:yes stop_codon:yes gene_type:complete
MSTIYDEYEAVIGLEVHAQLLTKSKAFSNDENSYGNQPNSNISPITLGHPGTLPRINQSQIDFAIKLGLACHCDLTEVNRFSRKNYFYADLPKGYQITQFDTPICTNGFVEIENGAKKIGLTRIHMEEDSGKSMHDQDPFNSLVDLNRAGVPLLEIVTEPELRTSDDAYHYLTEVRKLVRYLDICDGNMEEGSLRCDANISVRKKGVQQFGQKVEVKNMNSIRNVQRAIEFEITRQIDVLEQNGIIDHETRTFNAGDGSTTSMRSKEDANDYRFFPEPDLLPYVLTKKEIDAIRLTMPKLPKELKEKYTTKLGLSDYDAAIITDSKSIALYFEELISQTGNYKSAANWLMGDIKSYLNTNGLHISEFPVSATKIAELIKLVDSGKVSHSMASQKLFPLLIKDSTKALLTIAEENNLIQESDEDAVNDLIDKALSKFPKKVTEYKNGKKGLIGLFMGEVMKLSKGKADPKIANQLLRKKLEN